MSAGTTNYSATFPPSVVEHRAPNRVVFAWTADGSGNVDFTTPEAIAGTVVQVEFAPATGGDQPNDNYDVALLAESGYDILKVWGTDLPNAAQYRCCPGLANKSGTVLTSEGGIMNVPAVVCEKLRLLVTNAGPGKKGQVILYVR